MHDLATRIPLLLGAGQPALSVRTEEDLRFKLAIEEIAKAFEEKTPVITWDCVEGYRWNEETDKGRLAPLPFPDDGADYTSLLAALRALAGLESRQLRRAIVIFNDPHDFLAENVSARRQVKNMINQLDLVAHADEKTKDPGHRRMMIFVHPGQLHPELLSYLIPVDFPRPTEAEHTATIGAIRTKGGHVCPPELRSALAGICVGLTFKQAEDSVSESLREHKEFKPAMLSSIEQKKAALLGQQGFLHYVPMDDIPPVDSIRGFDQVKDFLNMAAQSYLPEFQELKLDRPQGLLLMGLAGTGKSEMGKLAARLFYEQTGKRFPLYLLNVPALFGGIVGQTEANVRWVTETLSAQGYYMLVIDELEKMLSTSGFNGDSGVSLRAVGQILTWLSERTNNPRDKGYVIGTLNTIEGIRPEFFRRFDGVFYTDLPTPEIRREIIESHFRRRGIDPATVIEDDGAWDAILQATENFIGSELRDIVVQSRNMAAFHRKSGVPNFDEVEETARNRATNIVFKTHRIEMDAIREYCRGAARPVHEQKSSTTVKKRPGRVVNTGE
jgi:SpoVK/Ycf46/Vps4 family AAA+-type ATPase